MGGEKRGRGGVRGGRDSTTEGGLLREYLGKLKIGGECRGEREESRASGSEAGQDLRKLHGLHRGKPKEVKKKLSVQ